MPWPKAIYWINELLTNTWVWLIEMPVWILLCIMKLEHWQVQPVGLFLSSRKWQGITEIIHTSKSCRTVLRKLSQRRHLLIQWPGRFTSPCHILCLFLLQLLLFYVFTDLLSPLQWQAKSGSTGLPLESWCEIRSHFPESQVQKRVTL